MNYPKNWYWHSKSTSNVQSKDPSKISQKIYSWGITGLKMGPTLIYNIHKVSSLPKSYRQVLVNKSLEFVVLLKPPDLKSLPTSSFNIPITNNLGPYIGFPLSHSRLNKSSFNFIVEKVWAKLQSWENKFLSLH